MKKQDFLDIVRSKSKKELTTEELNFFGAIGEAVERAFNENEKTQQASFKSITDKLGNIDDGETFANIVRKLADEVKQANENAKRNNSLSNIERFKLRAKLEEKKEYKFTLIPLEPLVLQGKVNKNEVEIRKSLQGSTIRGAIIQYGLDNGYGIEDLRKVSISEVKKYRGKDFEQNFSII